MHDMNLALDALRRAMPYAQGPAVKKLSKMNTLLLARNYILLLTRTLDELRRLLVASSGGELAGLASRRSAHPDLDALRSFVVRDLDAEHQRCVHTHVCLCTVYTALQKESSSYRPIRKSNFKSIQAGYADI